MEINSVVTSLNLTTGEALTLEKAADRMEFEALTIVYPIADNKESCKSDEPCSNYCFTFDPVPVKPNL